MTDRESPQQVAMEERQTQAQESMRKAPLRFVTMIQAMLLLLSLGAPAIGQFVLVARRDEPAAGLLYATGILAFLSCFAVRWVTSSASPSLRIAKPRLPSAREAVAIVAAILLGAALATMHTAPSRVSLVAWGCSLLLVLLATTPSFPLAAGFSLRRLWSIAAVLTSREGIAVICIVLVGTALRLWDLAGIPSGVHGDEAGETLVAVSVLAGKGPNPFGTAFQGDRALAFYLQAPFLAVFGSTITGMRLFSAVAGVLTLPIFYMLVRRLFGTRTGLIALVLLAGSAVHIHYSRMGLNVNQIPLLTCISLYCLRRGQEGHRGIWWLSSGMAAAFAVYFAFGGILLGLTVVFYLTHLLLTHRREWRAWSEGIAFWALGVGMVLAPIPVQMMGQTDPYADHAMSRMIFSNWDSVSARFHAYNWLEVLAGQLRLNLGLFFAKGDSSIFFSFAGAPMLAVVLGPFVALGLTLVLLRSRDDRYAMVALWFWTVVLLGGVITIGAPQSHRLLPAALAAMVGVALVIDWLIATAPRMLPRPLASSLLAIALALPVLAGVSDTTNYFGPAAASKPWETDTRQGQYIASLGPGYRVYVLGTPRFSFDVAVTRYLAPNVNGDDLLNPGLSLPLAVPADRDLAFLVYPHMEHYLPLLRSLYPSAQEEDVLGVGGGTLFKTLRIAREDVARSQSLTFRYGEKAGIEPDAGTLGAHAPSYPTNAIWSGSIYVEREGGYRFLADGPETALRIDDTPAVGDREMRLWAGWHSVYIEGPLQPGSRVVLKWAPPGQPLSVVPAHYLDPRQLEGNLRNVSVLDSGIAVERRDRTVGFRGIGRLFGGQGDIDARWEGTIDAPMDGEYEFGVRSSGKASLAIDGQPIITTSFDRWATYLVPGSVRLGAGPHSIEIRYEGPRENGLVELLWTVPGGSPSVILPESFLPTRTIP